MSKYPHRQEREEMRELLKQFQNLKAGRFPSFIEEEGFERLISYFKQTEEWPEAMDAAEFAIHQYPYSGAFLIHKADILLSMKRYRQALYILEQAEVVDSTQTDLYILKTDAYLALDMPEKAAAVLEAAIWNFDGEEKIDLLFELADVYDDYEDFQKVFDCLQSILEYDPENEEALYKICFWADFTGRNEESIGLHKNILDAHPFNELAWFNLGAAYQELKLFEKSIDAYQYAVAINDKFDYAYRNMGDAFIKLRKYKEAIEVLSRVIELSRPEAVIHEAIGHCYDRTGNFAQARFYYKKASHLEPEDSQLYFKIATTYMNEGSWAHAVKHLETALKRHTSQPEYNLAMGCCLAEMGKFDKALVYFGNVVRARPKSTKGWVELLRCLFRAGLYAEGLEYSGIAFEHSGNKPVFIYFRSLFLFATGKNKDALVWLEKAISVNPKLVREFIGTDPSILHNPEVARLIAGIKKRK